jgi:hypothetical protein
MLSLAPTTLDLPQPVASVLQLVSESGPRRSTAVSRAPGWVPLVAVLGSRTGGVVVDRSINRVEIPLVETPHTHMGIALPKTTVRLTRRTGRSDFAGIAARDDDE